MGWTGALLGRFHVTGVFWFRFHRFGVRILPDWLLGPMLTLFTTIFFVALIRIRRAIGRNLYVVMGPASWWERQRRAYRTLHNFAFCLTERYERLETGHDFEVALERGSGPFPPRPVSSSSPGTSATGSWAPALPAPRKAAEFISYVRKSSTPALRR